MDGVVLRGYREGDLEAMFALDVACFAERFRFSLADMRRFATARSARVVVSELNGELVGFGILDVERSGSQLIGYVVTLDVGLAFRRQGIAGHLMESMEVAAAEAGCGVVALHVSVENVGAVAFYEGLGYRRGARVRGFYGRDWDAWVYSRELL